MQRIDRKTGKVDVDVDAAAAGITYTLEGISYVNLSVVGDIQSSLIVEITCNIERTSSFDVD